MYIQRNWTNLYLKVQTSDQVQLRLVGTSWTSQVGIKRFQVRIRWNFSDFQERIRCLYSLYLLQNASVLWRIHDSQSCHSDLTIVIFHVILFPLFPPMKE